MAITLVVLTRNEAPRLRQCLASVAGAVQELLVVDSDSTDDTVAVARDCGARTLTRPWPGRAAQTEFALSQVRTPWTLQCDADERADATLAAALPAVVAAAGDLAGFRLDRREWFQGRRLRCGDHRGLLRLVRTDRAHAQPRRTHAGLLVDGPLGRLPGYLEHHVDQPLDELQRKLLARALLGAADARDAGRRATSLGLLWHPAATWLRLMLLKGGWRDGRGGLVFAGLRSAACFARLVELVRLQELGSAGE